MSKAAFYEKLAEEVVSDFFSASADPSESLAKVAHRETLNPEEIQRVAEISNQEIFASLRKDAGSDHTIEFDVADVRKVHEFLHPVKFATGPGLVRESVRSAPTPPPREWSDNGWDPTRAQKLAAYSALYEELYGIEVEEEDAFQEQATQVIHKFADVARMTAFDQSLSLETIRDAVTIARPKHAALIQSLVELAAQKSYQKLSKEASAACEYLFDQTISQGDGRPGKVINGDHALVILLDTLTNLEHQRTVSDSKKVYVEGVKNLLARRTTSL